MVNEDGVYGPETELGPSWERPKTPGGELRAFRAVRDHFLLSVLSGLQLRETHKLISVDEEARDRPIQILWDAETPRSLSWTDKYGSVGAGMLVKRRWPAEDGMFDEKYVGHIQIGGVYVDEKALRGVPTSWYLKAKRSRTTKKYAVLTQQAWFLSAWGLWLLDRKPEPGADQVVWHPVTEADFGKGLNRAFENAS